MYAIFTDTDTDFTPETCAKYGYHLISMPYVVDGKTIFPYEDFDTFCEHDFYNMLRKGTIPKTCAISPDKYVEYFEPIFKQGLDILYVHFSTAMSGTFNAMKLAVDALLHTYPERRFEEIDTKGITIGSYNIVCEVGDMYLAGKSMDEVLQWAETEVDKFAIYFYADDLKFFAKSGRVTNFSATMGNIIGIHPILNMGSDGMMTNIAKAQGRKGTMKRIIDYVDELQDDIHNHRVIIGHSDCLPLAQTFATLLEEKFGKLNIEYVVVNPTAGSHCGPDGIGVSFHAIHR